MSTTYAEDVTILEKELAERIEKSIKSVRENIADLPICGIPGDWLYRVIRRTTAYTIAQENENVQDIQRQRLSAGFLFEGFSFIEAYGWEPVVNLVFHYRHPRLTVCGDFMVTVNLRAKETIGTPVEGCFPKGDYSYQSQQQLHQSGEARMQQDAMFPWSKPVN